MRNENLTNIEDRNSMLTSCFIRNNDYDNLWPQYEEQNKEVWQYLLLYTASQKAQVTRSGFFVCLFV